VNAGPVTRLRWWRRWLARPLEYLGLRRAIALAGELAAERRATLSLAVEGATQKRDAAEVLQTRGSPAEAAALAVESGKALSTVLDALSGSSALQRGVVRSAFRDMEWALGQLAPVPALDRDVTRGQRRALRTLLAAELALGQPLRTALLEPRGLRWLRLQRWLLVLVVALSPLAIALFVRRSFYGPTARASGVLDDQYTADRVLDGDPDTEWVASGGDEWLELRMHKQVVHGVRILNGDTLPDRAAKELHVDFFNGDESHATHPRTFNEQHPAQWQTYDVGGIVCDRIRIVITQHYGAGAALAEVQVF
jgi:hypothetical protein